MTSSMWKNNVSLKAEICCAQNGLSNWASFIFCSLCCIATQCTKFSEQNKSKEIICSERKISGTYHLSLSKHLKEMKPWYQHYCCVMTTAVKYFTCEHAQCYLRLATWKQRDDPTTCLDDRIREKLETQISYTLKQSSSYREKKILYSSSKDNWLDARGNNLSTNLLRPRGWFTTVSSGLTHLPGGDHSAVQTETCEDSLHIKFQIYISISYIPNIWYYISWGKAATV